MLALQDRVGRQAARAVDGMAGGADLGRDGLALGRVGLGRAVWRRLASAGAERAMASNSSRGDFMSGASCCRDANPLILQCPMTDNLAARCHLRQRPAAAKRALAWTHSARFLTTAAGSTSCRRPNWPRSPSSGAATPASPPPSTAWPSRSAWPLPRARPGARSTSTCSRWAEGRARRAVRRPAGLWLCGRGTRGQAALAGGDGAVPGAAAQPVGRGADDRFAPGLHRPGPAAAAA